MSLALVVAVGGLDLGLLHVALVSGLVDLGVSDVGVHVARGSAAWVLLKLYVWWESESWSIAHKQMLVVLMFDEAVNALVQDECGRRQRQPELRLLASTYILQTSKTTRGKDACWFGLVIGVH